MIDSCLYKKVNGNWIPYIRPSRRMELLRMFHFIGTGHASDKRMMDTMASYCYWESLHHDINDLCSSCTTCAMNRKLTKQHYSLILPNCAFHTVSIDVMGPIKRTTTSSTAQYIIAAVDHFTKWVEAEVISSPTAKVTASFIMSNIIARHGCRRLFSRIMEQISQAN